MNHAELLRTVAYDPHTGAFTRLKPAGNRAAGTPIGNRTRKGYLKARVLGQYVKLHRLAWFYVTGVWPEREIDHINRVKDDNRFDNLRDVGTSENCLNQVEPRKNNRTGLLGVHSVRKTGRFRATCSIKGEKHHLGVFATPEEAHAAYVAFKKEHTCTSNT